MIKIFHYIRFSYSKIKGLSYLHPLLFASYPFLTFYTTNIEQMKFVRIVQPLEISIASTIVLWLLLNAIIKNKHKTSLLVTYFLLLFFSYGHVYNALDESLFSNREGESNVFLFPLYLFFLLGGGFLIIKLFRHLLEITKVIGVIGLFLIFISLLQVLHFHLQFNRVLSFSPVTTKISARIGKVVDSENQNTFLNYTSPNIYYIILDEYANNEVLKNIFDYDNTELTSFLEDKRFKVFSQARSNYSQTTLSLASSLNMKYINYLADVLGEDSINTLLLTQMIKNNEVIRFIKSKGYKTVNFSSGWTGGTDRNRFVDINIFCVRNNDVITNLLLTTMLRPFENMFMNENMRQRVLCTFSRLAEINKEVKEPIFVLAHFVSPHPPFIFRPNGEPVNYSKFKNGNDFPNKEGYINQLRFINKNVEELVEKLTADKDNLPIIIIQADHGTASMPTDWKNNNPALIYERMRPFVATFLPGENDFIPDSITPVNIFRLIFNNYFNTKYELLENKVYFSTYEKPYKFLDVTEEVWKKDASASAF